MGSEQLEMEVQLGQGERSAREEACDRIQHQKVHRFRKCAAEQMEPMGARVLEKWTGQGQVQRTVPEGKALSGIAQEEV